ncbi:MAG: metallophosphoesterase [Armatimonadetes bacterium]|nr:metallophosphoesterase [Armatimonadota bacterium]
MRLPLASLALLLTLLLATASGWPLAGAALQASAEPELGPYLQWVTPRSAVIRWQTAVEAIGHVDFGAPGRLDRTVSEAQPTRLHEVRLCDLHPETIYGYRVRWHDQQTEEYRFRTAPPRGRRRFRLVCYGDSRTDPATHARLVQRILAEAPDLVVSTGDLVAAGRVLEQWKPMFFDPLRPLMRSICYWPSLGNHEQNADIYYQLFSLPGNEAWYSFDWGHAHFIALDSNQRFEPGSPQVCWLEQDLRATRQPWKIAFFHHPLFSAHPTRGINAVRWSWQPILQKLGVNLVFTGHDHHYQRTFAIGSAARPYKPPTWQFTTGGGGAPLYPVQQQIWTEVTRSVHHYLVLDFEDEAVRGRAVSVDGEEIDRFTIRRRERPEEAHFVAWEPFLLEKLVGAALERQELVEAAPGEPFTVERPLHLLNSELPPLTGEVVWEAPAGWQITPERSTWRVDAWKGLEWKFTARSCWPECYPLPRVRFRLYKGSLARNFRNTEFELRPFRVWPRRTVEIAPLPQGAIQIDGRPDEPAWGEAAEQVAFVRSDGTELALQPTRFRLARDAERLYLAAFITQQDIALLDAGETERDASQIASGNEHLLLRLARGDVRYDLGLNSRGTLYDARNGNLAWNPTWQARVAHTPDGWTVEMAVPLTALDGARPRPGEEWRFNVQRGDRKAEDRSEWVPTFGALSDVSRYGTLRWR